MDALFPERVEIGVFEGGTCNLENDSFELSVKMGDAAAFFIALLLILGRAAFPPITPTP